MYKISEKDVEYFDDILDSIEHHKVFNDTTCIIKGLKFLALKGAGGIYAQPEELIVEVDNVLFCDADLLYLNKYGWCLNWIENTYTYML